MPKIVVPDATWKGFTLPGGWTTHVPKISVDPADPRIRDMIQLLMRQGATRAKAEAYVIASVEEFFAKAWKARLMKLVSRWAKMYADQNFGSLEGFDPELLARTWVPGSGGPEAEGRGIKRMFVQMRRGDEDDEA